MLTQSLSTGSFNTSVQNSQAQAIASSLKYSPKEKLPSISKKVPCLAVFPTLSISGVLMHFWQVVTLKLGGSACPVKNGFNGAIPEFMISKLLSLCGTRDALFILKCPLLSKKPRNFSLIAFNPNFSIINPPV